MLSQVSSRTTRGGAAADGPGASNRTTHGRVTMQCTCTVCCPRSRPGDLLAPAIAPALPHPAPAPAPATASAPASAPAAAIAAPAPTPASSTVVKLICSMMRKRGRVGAPAAPSHRMSWAWLDARGQPRSARTPGTSSAALVQRWLYSRWKLRRSRLGILLRVCPGLGSAWGCSVLCSIQHLRPTCLHAPPWMGPLEPWSCLKLIP